jgi:carbon storage regulator CsrA
VGFHAWEFTKSASGLLDIDVTKVAIVGPSQFQEFVPANLSTSGLCLSDIPHLFSPKMFGLSCPSINYTIESTESRNGYLKSFKEGTKMTWLVLSRKEAENVILRDEAGNKIGTVHVHEIRGDKVRMGFDFPRTVKILREEVDERSKQREETPVS